MSWEKTGQPEPEGKDKEPLAKHARNAKEGNFESKNLNPCFKGLKQGMDSCPDLLLILLKNPGNKYLLQQCNYMRKRLLYFLSLHPTFAFLACFARDSYSPSGTVMRDELGRKRDSRNGKGENFESKNLNPCSEELKLRGQLSAFLNIVMRNNVFYIC